MFWLTPFKLLAETLTDASSSRQIALGFAFGVIIGLVPKGNLIAVGLMTVLYAANVNLAAGMMGAFLFSWAGLVLDPYTDRIGHWLLTHQSLTPHWTYLYNLPGMPWTAFNNTVVLGSLALGLVLFYPVYRTCIPIANWMVPRMRSKLEKYRIVRVLWGVDLAGKMGAA